MIDLEKLTIREARKHLDGGDFSCVELAEAYLKNIEDKDSKVHAYLEIYNDVLDQARKADKKLETNDYRLSTSLVGIPLGVKDNILIEGHTASAGSKILENYTATYDATVTTKLKEAGAVFLGRTNMDEFAMGSSTEGSAFGPTKNPHDLDRVPGGSSGGSAAAVSGGLALGALGSDTGGSVRQPAAFCGVVGLKPTYGSVSRNGLIALGSSFDCIGPITKTVEDAEILFNAIKGKDPLDSTSVDSSDYSNDSGLRTNDSLVIGVPRDLLKNVTSKSVLENFESALKKLEEAGYTLKDIKLPSAEYAVPTYYIILPAEASTNLARFDGVKYGLHVDGEDLLDDYVKTRGQGFGPEPRRRIILGTYVLSHGYYDAYYNKAQAVRRLITEDILRAFEDVDAIALPTTAGPAFKIGEKVDDPVQMYLEDIFTSLANLSGIPAISIPSGAVDVEGKKLPLGLQLLARHMMEETLFDIGKKFERLA